MREMSILQVLEKYNLDKSLIFGYYGGGNFGDELLLEVLQNLLRQKGVKRLSIPYQYPQNFKKFHLDMGYTVFDVRDRKALLAETRKNKNVIVGGGGLWGVDMNFNTLLMSLYLFMSHFFLRKRVYLLGVGYYNSTNRMGHIGAWLATKAATIVIARDQEAYDNFSKFSKNVYYDSDIAWYIDRVDVSPYKEGVEKIEKTLTINKDAVFVSLRRSQAKHQKDVFESFTQVVEQAIKANQETTIIIGLLESESKSPKEFAIARGWAKKYKNVQVLDGSVNPLILFMLFRKYKKKLALVGPQFHIIIIAHLNSIPFLPMVYDNKVAALMNHVGIKPKDQIPIKDVTEKSITAFIKRIGR